MKTTKSFSMKAFAIAWAFLAASAGTVGAALTGAQINPGSGFVNAGSGTSCNVENPPVISITASEHDAVWVNFRYRGATWRLPMTNGVAPYCLNMPVIPSGTVEYRIEAGSAFDPFSSTNAVEFLPSSSTYYTYVNSNLPLPEQRKPYLAGWYSSYFQPGGHTDDAYATTGYINNDWRAVALSMNYDATVNMLGKSDSQGAHLDAAIRTRTLQTVGSIWFKARYTGGVGASGVLVIDRSTNVNPLFAHDVIATVQVPTTPKWVLYRIDVNDDTASHYYRIRHPSGTEYGTSRIEIKDIVFTPAVADVTVTKAMVEHDPGYPSRTDPVTFTITAQSTYAGAPASNISPKLIWRLNKGLASGAWNTAYMASIGDDQYQVTLPPLDPGDFQYYYRVDFTGYAHTTDLYLTPNTTIINLNDFSKWKDANDRVAESRSPAYYPDFPNSHLYNLAVDPPVCLNDGSEWDEALQPFDYLGFSIRRFRSKHREVSLDVNDLSGHGLNIAPAYNMEQVGDYIWQSVIHMTNAVAEGNNVDVGIAVLGSERYNPIASLYESMPNTWLAPDQDETAWNPPMSGFLSDTATNGTPRLRVQLDYDGFLMFRFCTTNGSYEIRRAAWQDFNSWQANNTEFTRSFGLYATTVFESDLDDFPPTTMLSAGFIPFESGTTASDTDMLSAAYLNGVKVDKAWIIEERGRANPADASSMLRNRAVKLSADPMWPGSIETTKATATDGRDTLNLRVRASFDDDPANAAVYKKGYSFANYIVKAVTTVTSMSDDEASVSVYGYYQDEENYIEGRLVQRSDLTGSATPSYWLTSEIRQMKHGELSVLKSANITGTNAGTRRLDGGVWILLLKISSTDHRIDFNIAKTTESTIVNTQNITFTLDTDVSEGGTIGVNARDAAATFGMVVTDLSNGSVAPFSAVQTSPVGDWIRGGIMPGTSAYRWTFTQGSGSASPSSLTRTIPTVKYRVNVYRDGVNTDNVIAPVPTATEDWDPDWDVAGSADAERSTSSLAWQNVSVPMHFWDNVFIQIKPTGSDGRLVVDDLDVKSWRGLTLYDDELSENDPFEELVWKATYAVRSNVGGNVMYELNRTRANPNENQMIVTPLLEDGIGDLLFNYRVATGNVKFSVQTLRSNGTVDRTLLTTNIVASPNFERMYVAALTNTTGRMRILVDPVESSLDGILYIDNLKATDYPDAGDTSWKAYNILISTYDWNPEIKFDGAANADYRSATINDAYTNNTPLGVAYDDDEPYIQSPKIETGVGEVSFWYRRYPGATKPGKVYLKAAKLESDFENNPSAVMTLGLDDLNPQSSTYASQVACLEDIVNVTNDVWTYFSVEFYKAEYKILRFYGDTEDSGRVMLDNIIVTEPVRSSIDIRSVELVPAIPLYTDDVNVRVRLGNPRMNPHNIKAWLLYTIGTTPWGRQNWMGSAASIELVKDPEDPYLFYSTNAIPKQGVDMVVQYTVKVSYDGIFPADVYYDEEFVNPSWYEPIDLNEQYSAFGKSPYYYVLSVGTNCVFINEFLPYAYQFAYYGLDEQYVELIGVENGDVSNWRLEHVDPIASGDQDVVIWTNVLKNGATFRSRYVESSQEPRDKGWGFYLLACAGVNNENPNFSMMGSNPIVVDQVLFPASLYLPDYSGFPVGAPEIGMGVPGALCLRRSMGAYVHRLVWGQYESVKHLEERGYIYCGTRGTTGNNRRRVFIWADNGDTFNPQLEWDDLSTLFYSPGYYNDGQAELIWPITPAEGGEEPEAPPLIAQPRITSITVGETAATVVFDVWTTNDVALTEQDAYTWYVEFSEDPTFANPTALEIETPIVSPSDGSPSSYSVDVDFGDPPSQSLFYRIKAVHP